MAVGKKIWTSLFVMPLKHWCVSLPHVQSPSSGSSSASPSCGLFSCLFLPTPSPVPAADASEDLLYLISLAERALSLVFLPYLSWGNNSSCRQISGLCLVVPSSSVRVWGCFAQASDCLRRGIWRQERGVDAVWPAGFPQPTKWAVKPSLKEESNHSLIARKKKPWRAVGDDLGVLQIPPSPGVGTYQKDEKCETLAARRGVLEKPFDIGVFCKCRL